MKKEIWLLLLLLPLFNSCSEYGSKKFNLELIEDNPYILRINNFDWHWENGHAVGDFNSLDTAMDHLLYNKYGICEIYIQHNSELGKSIEGYDYIGFINVQYTDDGISLETNDGPGEIRSMVEHHLHPKEQQQNPDAIKTDTLPNRDSINRQPFQQSPELVQTVYSFSVDELHREEEDRANLDSATFTLKGTIEFVDFDSGKVQVRTSNGKKITVEFSPNLLNQDVYDRLKLALIPGNKIKSFCATVDPGIIDIVTAEITSSNTVNRFHDTSKMLM